MALTNTNKLIIGLTSAGAVGGTGAGIYYLNNSKEADISQNNDKEVTENKVSHKLTKAGFSPFKTDGTELGKTWADMIIKYKKIKETETELENIEDFEALKKKCFSALSSEDTEEANYSFAKRFCVNEETITQMLERNGYKKLGENTPEADKAKWEKKLVAIKADELAIKAMSLEFKNDDNDSGLLVVACAKIETSNIKTYENKDFEKNYNNAKNWCYWNNNEN